MTVGTYSYNGPSGTATDTFTGMERTDGTENADVFDISASVAGVGGIWTMAAMTLFWAAHSSTFSQSVLAIILSMAAAAMMISGSMAPTSRPRLMAAPAMIICGLTLAQLTPPMCCRTTLARIRSELGANLDTGAGDGIGASGLTNGVAVSYTTDVDGTLVEGANSVTFENLEFFTLTDQADIYDGSGSSLSHNVDGGAGADILTGGTGADVFVVGDGGDIITDFDPTTGIDGGVTSNNDYVSLSAYYNQTNLDAWKLANPDNQYATPLGWLRADQVDDGTLGQVGGSRILGTDDQPVASTALVVENTGVVCFTSGTAIRTPNGDVLIDELRVGDLVTTMDNGPQRIAWIGQRHVTHSELRQNERLHPVLIKKGVLGGRNVTCWCRASKACSWGKTTLHGQHIWPKPCRSCGSQQGAVAILRPSDCQSNFWIYAMSSGSEETMIAQMLKSIIFISSSRFSWVVCTQNRRLLDGKVTSAIMFVAPAQIISRTRAHLQMKTLDPKVNLLCARL